MKKMMMSLMVFLMASTSFAGTIGHYSHQRGINSISINKNIEGEYEIIVRIADGAIHMEKTSSYADASALVRDLSKEGTEFFCDLENHPSLANDHVCKLAYINGL